MERFQSLADPNRILSLSFWRDEDAVKAWRNTEEHRQAQQAGRGGIFAGSPYELRNTYRDGIQRIPLAIYELDIPVIAAVNGPASLE